MIPVSRLRFTRSTGELTVLAQPLDLTEVRLQASGDKRMLESRRCASPSVCPLLPPCAFVTRLTDCGQACPRYSTAYRGPRCTRCHTRCATSGCTTRARRSLVRGRTRLRASLRLRGVWVRLVPPPPLFRFDSPLYAETHRRNVSNPAGAFPSPSPPHPFYSLCTS